ncbi:MAG: hydrogenase iron-sulfur subunit [Deltaproteobacteria bacterium]|nr:hydrogenase iron-sulfur subunit [Deltaproteobacteria bacterium]
MSGLKIVLFLCNWAPHAAFQKLQEYGSLIPPEVRMVRVPCTGRVTKSLLFKAFEMGADGVALVGCESGACRYGSGTAIASRNAEDAREILELLALGKERLRIATFLPEESEGLRRFLTGFAEDLRGMGASPVEVVGRSIDSERRPISLQLSDADPGVGTKERRNVTAEIVAAYDMYACQDCGKCSSACPLTLSGKAFSPRALANAVIGGHMDSPVVARDVWSCLTCGLCYDRCPSAVEFHEFVRRMREVLRDQGKAGHEAHDGFFQSLMRTMTSPALKIDKWKWLPEGIRTDPGSKTLFFGGCAPYFDIFFGHHLGVRTREILVDSLRLLNFFDIHPALIPGERCCGHDLLWTGDREGFLALARLNVEAFRSAGIEEIITACPECFRTLNHDYPKQGIQMPCKVTHLYEFLEQQIEKGAVGFAPLHRRITFQDPCRLSRMENRPELPRKLLGRLRPLHFKEMQDHGNSALCCGNCAWTGCDSYTKALQVKRLQQAKSTGSDLLVTACPKCQIHLRCAMEDPFRGKEIEMELMDLTTLLAKTIHWE